MTFKLIEKDLSKYFKRNTFELCVEYIFWSTCANARSAIHDVRLLVYIARMTKEIKQNVYDQVQKGTRASLKSAWMIVNTKS